jgi:hypothetical protein
MDFADSFHGQPLFSLPVLAPLIQKYLFSRKWCDECREQPLYEVNLRNSTAQQTIFVFGSLIEILFR